MKSTLLLKSILLTAAVYGASLPVQASHTTLTPEYLLLHSRVDSDGDPGTASPYFISSDPYNNTSAFSPVGGNGPGGGSFFTSSHFDIVGVRSAAFVLDADTLGVTLAGLYDLDITWGTQTNLRIARVEVTDATGTTTLLVDQGATANEWVNLGLFTFSGAVGEEVRIWNDGVEGASLSGNIQFDSIQLTQVPEPSTYAAIFGGLALLGAFVYRRRARATK